MHVSVIGAGYVGLVTAACLADVGNVVVCVDTDIAKVEKLNRSEVPIHEPDLDDLVERNAAAGRLRFSSDYDAAVSHATLILIAVGTPSSEDGSADLSHVIVCAAELGRRIERDTLIVVKSTVPVGTNDQVRAAIRSELGKRGSQTSVTTASNPEFLKEGFAVEDFMKPDRIVVGVDDAKSAKTLRELYKPFNRNRDRLIVMDIRSAEFTKYAANCMLAVRISFMNEMANLADRLGVDIEDVRRGIGSDPRIGPDFLYAGAGFGGSCFPKDLRALMHTAAQYDEPVEILAAAMEVNQRQQHILAAKISRFFGGELAGRTIALWGLAFKANTDDMREAPSLSVINALTSAGAKVHAYDPVAMTNARSIIEANKNVQFTDSAAAALHGADVLAVITEWLEFRSPDFEDLARKLKAKAVFDGRNLYDPSAVRAAGLQYIGIGRGL
ncbi:MAG TPA: UDP-glucose/GDP-mannose dehydrogenase family protein [Burkholderiaceae bacterium]|nr:UDP-glucose/GDP-mannose dehydrogenase family protein [Burkholderiaceae bacterium]